MGPRHRPISNRHLVDTVLDAAPLYFGDGIENLQLFQSKDATQLLGSLDLPGYLDTPDLDRKDGKSFMPSLFFWHGNRQQRSLVVGVGGSVFICENGMLSATWTSRRKHTTGLNLWDHIHDVMGQMRIRLGHQQRDVNRMTQERFHALGTGNRVIGEARIARLIGQGDLTGAAGRKAWQDWIKPAHDFGEGSRWHWYNAVNAGVKGMSVVSQARALEKAWGMALAA
jgi:hypothetical protein